MAAIPLSIYPSLSLLIPVSNHHNPPLSGVYHGFLFLSLSPPRVGWIHLCMRRLPSFHLISFFFFFCPFHLILRFFSKRQVVGMRSVCMCVCVSIWICMWASCWCRCCCCCISCRNDNRHIKAPWEQVCLCVFVCVCVCRLQTEHKHWPCKLIRANIVYMISTVSAVNISHLRDVLFL